MTATIDFTEGQVVINAHLRDALGEPTSSGQLLADAQPRFAAGTNLPDASHVATAQKPSASGTQLAESTPESNVHAACDSATNSTRDQKLDDHQLVNVAGGSTSADHRHVDSHRVSVGGSTSTGGQSPNEAQLALAPGGFLNNPMLALFAKVVDDFEAMRIATANRVRIFTQTGEDSDGIERGFGLPVEMREIERLNATVAAMEKAEHDAILALQRAVRRHPLGDFQKRYRGLGEKQFARLLGVIGDPYWNSLHNRPRTVSELWAYAGYHVIQTSGSQRSVDSQVSGAAGPNSTPGAMTSSNAQEVHAPGVAPKRQRGQRSNWSEDARKRCFVIAESLMKGGRKADDDKRGEQDPALDHFRIVYDATRAKYAEAVHSSDCVRCGPAGKPALAGSPLSDAHKHARALRAVAKEFLKLLWIEARSIYNPDGQIPCDAHRRPAVGASTSADPNEPPLTQWRSGSADSTNQEGL